MSIYQPTILALCRADKLPEPAFEVMFAPPRRWRFDVAWDGGPNGPKVALEIQGGLFVRGRHVRGAALLKEHAKLNAAARLGWRVMFASPSTLTAVWPEVIEAVRRA